MNKMYIFILNFFDIFRLTFTYIREQESHDIAIEKLTTKEYTNPFGNKKK